MKNSFTHILSNYTLQIVLLLFIWLPQTQNLTAQPLAVTINGLASGSSIQQGDSMRWIITGISNGATVNDEFWIDKDNNGIINSNIDLLFVQFSQTDGVSSNNGPGDDDGLANGIIDTKIMGEYFPVANYIFRSSIGSNIAQATCAFTALQVTTFSVSGSVKKLGVGMPNIVVQINLQNGNGEYFALTNAQGNYSINTNLVAGTNIEVRVAKEPFNLVLMNGLLVTPNRVQTSLNNNIANLNFSVSDGKIITGKVKDALDNPIQGYDVNIFNDADNSINYYAQTNENGIYAIPVDIGTYKVCFGNTNEPLGNLLTYYNQKNLRASSDIITVTAATDSIKNIDAIIYKGALITGTFKENGQSIQGMIYASNYNNPQSRVYESWYDAQGGNYYLYVLPGTYSIKFQKYGNDLNSLYYNQSTVAQGTAIIVNSVNDVISNVNVNFSNTVPIIFKSVNATVQRTQVLIQWSASSELEVMEYIIEKSTNGTEFYDIGSQFINKTLNYSFKDKAPLNGFNFYRIKAIDKDGSYLYSSIVKVELYNIKDFVVYPNPIVNNRATIQLKGYEKGTYILTVYNAIGQVLYTKQILIDIDTLLYNVLLPVKGMNKIEISGGGVKHFKTILVL